jgi:hypothetical protein
MADGSLSTKLRQRVMDRSRGSCEYCRSQVSFSPDPFSIEHALPKAKG